MKKSLIAATALLALASISAHAADDAGKPAVPSTDTAAPTTSGMTDATTSAAPAAIGSTDSGATTSIPATPVAPPSDADKK